MRLTARNAWIVLAALLYAAAAVSIFGQGGTSQKRTYVGGRFALVLDGVNLGYLKGIDGGEISSDVVLEKTGASLTTKKHIGSPRYGEYSLQFGSGLDPKLYDWISASWNMSYQRKNGAISTADNQYREVARTEFFNALITETSIPACDASAKEPAYFEVAIAPEYTRPAKPSGGAPGLGLTVSAPPRGGRPLPGGLVSRSLPPSGAAAPPAGGAPAGGQGIRDARPWLPMNFRLTINGLDCTRVTKIDSFTIKQTVQSDALGVQRDYLKEPGKIEFPNLVVTISELGGQTWRDWFEDFVIKGNCGEDKEKMGTLEFLAPNRQDVLFTITFRNLGIFKLAPAPMESNSEQVRRFKVEMYCEKMEFKALPPKPG